MYEDVFDFVGLFDADGDADGVDGGFNQDFLILVPGDGEGVEEQFGGRLGFDFGDVMSFAGLGGEVGQGEGCS